MTTDWVTDENGSKLLVKRIHKGRIIPASFVASGTERMTETPLRPDDTLILSYPKAGCHWIWENLRFIVAGEIKPDSIEKDEYMMDQHEFGKFDDLPSPRILNNHACFDDQPRDLLKGDVKVIFPYRNPKDTVVSFYHHLSNSPKFGYDGVFSAFLKLFAEGKVPYNYFDYMQSWEEAFKMNPQIPVLFLRYEDMLKNPLAERRRIAEFCGKQCDDDFLNAVAEATTIDKMRARKETFIGKDGQKLMYRKGKIGDWKEHFTVDDNEWYDRVIQEKLGNSKLFNFIYE